MLLDVDECVLVAVAGVDAFRRGKDYATRGLVVQPSLQRNGQLLIGQVRGGSPRPYATTATIGTASNGELASFRGRCSCPVATNCKHAVALVLAARSTVPTAPPPEWEAALGAVAHDARPPAEPAVALMFDLDADREAPRMLLRPAVRGKAGGWIRTGIAWSSFSYVPAAGNALDDQQLQLLREVLLLGPNRSSSYYYSSQTQGIDLCSVVSRRIWDVLADLERSGVPLVLPGKRPSAVRMDAVRAAVSLDVTRYDRGLALSPQVSAGERRLDPAEVVLLGEPAHAVAWWPAGNAGRALTITPLERPLTREVRALVGHGTVQVPAADETRFFTSYYPRVRRHVPLTSADASVALPEPATPELVAAVRHLTGHRVTVAWAWRLVVGEAVRELPLHVTDRELWWHDRAALSTVEAVTATVPGLLESPSARLAAEATLAGLDAARFTLDTLPRLQAIDGLTVEVSGEEPDYREAQGEPLVRIKGTDESVTQDWFDLAVTVSIDGQDVPFQPLFVALASGETHLLLPSGTFFDLDNPTLHQLRELIAEARAMHDSPPGVVRLSRYQASLWDDLDRLGVISGQAGEWRASATALAAAEFAEVPVPANLHAQLRPYQRDGFNWLAFLYDHGLGGVLADEMGLGKTVQTLALICHARSRDPGGAPFLVVAPTSVVPNWVAECTRFAPHLRVAAITETQRRSVADLAHIAREADVVVTSYTLFRLDHDTYAAERWAGLLLDEAQFVKNHQAQAYQCARKLAAPFKVAITGTPLENNLMELWSLLSITAPGLFAQPAKFDDYYRSAIERRHDEARLDLLRRRIRPLMLRRTKELVARDLPDKQEQVLELELAPKHRRVYQAHLQRERQKVLGLLGDLEQNRFEIFRSLTLLRQASLDIGLIDPAHANIPSTKLDTLCEMLAEISREGHRTIVFSQFTRFLTTARRRLEAAGIGCAYLDGKTRRRGDVIQSFKDGAAPVFLISLKAGGFGLNLTEADYCVLLDPWWNPASEAQAVDRVHRIGQRNKVMVYRLVSKDTIEEKVMALKARKAALFDSVLSGADFASAKLSAADIRAMLA